MNFNILTQAIDTFGTDSQVNKMVEESAELTVALMKLKQHFNEKNKTAVIDEIADVKIMISQMQLLFGFDDVEKRIDFKMERLAKRINKKSKNLKIKKNEN